MSDSPRRARADGWAWACLALFGPGDESADSPNDGTSDDEARHDDSTIPE
ncbi:hypothetical protein J2744_001068 [Halorubrum trapanicum]|uniref:Uncharacterized protein n=1 Tax=Halorubrum trapanicum TaxID=29284 RepID=A0A8J7R865_9EURY|nr:hypothetical protein [Halorubrum trapanicum]MBP1901398.1 hypothetical protein [Halorubrum trapanicum]